MKLIILFLLACLNAGAQKDSTMTTNPIALGHTVYCGNIPAWVKGAIPLSRRPISTCLTCRDLWEGSYERCPHIYVAIQPDTLVWDKKPQEIRVPIASAWTVDTMRNYHSYINPPPLPIKIICLLCHKQTEQKIKIVNEGNETSLLYLTHPSLKIYDEYQQSLTDQGFRGMSYFETPPLIKQNYYTMTDYISPFDIPKHDLKCLIDGKIVPYDAMSSDTSQETKDFYKAFEIIGSGKTFFVDGVKNVEPEEKYFWKRK